MYRNRPVFVLVLCVAFFVASIPAQAGRTRGSAAKVTFRDLTSDRVQSDGVTGGDSSLAYINDVEGVKASYDTSGLAVTLGRTRPAEYTRHVFFDFTAHATTGADGSECTSWTPPADTWTPETTKIYAEPIGITMGAMLMGQTVDATVQFDTVDGRSDWLVRFDNAMYPASSNATVTRVNGFTWTYTVEASCVGVLVEPPTRQNPNGIQHGYYTMEFSFDVEQL